MKTNGSFLTWNTGVRPFGELRREVDRLFDDVWTFSPLTTQFAHTGASGEKDREW